MIGMREVRRGTESSFEFFEVGEFGAIIEGQRTHELARYLSKGAQCGQVQRRGPLVRHQTRHEQTFRFTVESSLPFSIDQAFSPFFSWAVGFLGLRPRLV